MKQRAAETLFKHKLLILLPLMIILPLTVMIALRPKPVQWQSYATVWVDLYRPLYQDDRLTYAPAASQSQLLNDFLRTRSFALGVVQDTRLAGQVTGPDSEDRAVRTIWRSVKVWPSSTNFINIVVTTSDPELAPEIGQSLLKHFQDVLKARMEVQSKAALALYADKLQKDEQQLQKSRNELAAYLAANPQLATRRPDSAISPESQDVNLARLTSQVTTDTQSYNATRQRFEDLKVGSAAGIEGQQLAFNVVDAPQQPRRPLGSSRMGLVKLPMIGMLMGLMLGSAIAVLLVVTNRSVLSTHDIRSSLSLPVLGEIPELRRRRWPWQRSPRHAVRIRLTAPARRVPPPPTGAGSAGDTPARRPVSALQG